MNELRKFGDAFSRKTSTVGSKIANASITPASVRRNLIGKLSGPKELNSFVGELNAYIQTLEKLSKQQEMLQQYALQWAEVEKETGGPNGQVVHGLLAQVSDCIKGFDDRSSAAASKLKATAVPSFKELACMYEELDRARRELHRAEKTLETDTEALTKARIKGQDDVVKRCADAVSAAQQDVDAKRRTFDGTNQRVTANKISMTKRSVLEMFTTFKDYHGACSDEAGAVVKAVSLTADESYGSHDVSLDSGGQSSRSNHPPSMMGNHQGSEGQTYMNADSFFNTNSSSMDNADFPRTTAPLAASAPPTYSAPDVPFAMPVQPVQAVEGLVFPSSASSDVVATSCPPPTSCVSSADALTNVNFMQGM
eukprot:Rmarinus@m.27773